MHIVDLKPGLCDGNYSTGSIITLDLIFFTFSGVWSCVTAEFFVKRGIFFQTKKNVKINRNHTPCNAKLCANHINCCDLMVFLLARCRSSAGTSITRDYYAFDPFHASKRRANGTSRS